MIICFVTKPMNCLYRSVAIPKELQHLRTWPFFDGANLNHVLSTTHQQYQRYALCQLWNRSSRDPSRTKHSCLFCKNMDCKTPASPSKVLAHHCAITSGAFVHDEACTTRGFLAVKKSAIDNTQSCCVDNLPSCCCSCSLRRRTHILAVNDSVSTLLEQGS